MQDWRKSSPQDCVSPRGHFASRLFQLSSSFSEINSSAKIRMALKRHTVLHRLTKIWWVKIFSRVKIEFLTITISKILVFDWPGPYKLGYNRKKKRFRVFTKITTFELGKIFLKNRIRSYHENAIFFVFSDSWNQTSKSESARSISVFNVISECLSD